MADGTVGGLSNDGELAVEAPSKLPELNLNSLQTVYVLPARIALDDLHEKENQLSRSGARLTYDIREARLVLGNITKPRRAKFELQAGKVRFRDIDQSSQPNLCPKTEVISEVAVSRPPPKKRLKLEGTETQSTTDASTTTEHHDSSTVGSETEADDDAGAEPLSQLSISQGPTSPITDSSPPPEVPPSPQLQEDFADRIKVVNLKWLEDSVRLGKPQEIANYLVYEAELLPPDAGSPTPEPPATAPVQRAASPSVERSHSREASDVKGILERANADAKSKPKPKVYFSRAGKRDRISDAAKRDFAGRSFTSTTSKVRDSQPPHLLHQTTSEYEEGVSSSLPPMPDWVLQNKKYSCERATPPNSPNDAFIDQLKEIKLARLLTDDEIGVRAYSTSIASLAAYPYAIQSTAEILALPGCDHKIAHLFHEWQTSPDHCIQAVKDIQNDPVLKVLRLFYEIWGVGATTAREFYYDKQWRDLDDIVEFGWSSLSRVQQIGVKYYEEFLLKIPRAEVEAIADIVTRHARSVVDDRVECIIVGGHRRGKAESGDVDLILSHPDQSATAGLVDKVVRSLEKEDWITHTLLLNLTNTKRGQEPVPYFSNTKGAGFDTLDKALVVWQDQAFPGKGNTDEQGKPVKNPNPHRRVDIIISPWRTVGCAVEGWTSGTTFQRDLRRYAKRVKGWKFDSSGVRERGSGRWVDLEGWTDPKTRCTDWKEAERRVFEGMGLEYREPWDRCTG
ncbi:MAG: hypothetical protein LQ338_000246 [Usnochroma carphineum]|nr:MAG: hypothetical protein LQ338_000246 [Usnochroma carphineum]